MQKPSASKVQLTDFEPGRDTATESRPVDEAPGPEKPFRSGILLLLCLLGAGLMARMWAYITPRCLWADEAKIALNVMNRSFGELFQPLDYSQAAPIGFLVLEKLTVSIFGGSEYAWRLLPFVLGCLALPLFLLLAKHYIKSSAIPIALAFFALSPPLVHYSSEAKQYGIDVFVSIILLYLFSTHLKQPANLPKLCSLAIVGAAGIWLSFPLIFVLAGGLIAISLPGRSVSLSVRFANCVLLVLVWATSFLASYGLTVNASSQDTFLLSFWKKYFMPLPPQTLADARWFIDSFLRIFYDPGGFPLPALAAFCCVVGCVSMLRKDRQRFTVICAPILLCLLASGLHKYPFAGRLLLFVVPAAFLLVAEGAVEVWQRVRGHHPLVLASAAFVALAISLVPVPAENRMAFSKRCGTAVHYEEVKPILDYVSKHHQTGDVVYIYYRAIFGFRYYSRYCGLREEDCLIGACGLYDRAKCIKQLESLAGRKRVWLIFSHLPSSAQVSEEELICRLMNNLGQELDCYKRPGASAYLYDLTKHNLKAST